MRFPSLSRNKNIRIPISLSSNIPASTPLLQIFRHRVEVFLPYNHACLEQSRHGGFVINSQQLFAVMVDQLKQTGYGHLRRPFQRASAAIFHVSPNEGRDSIRTNAHSHRGL
jgi:hypothetical protein